MNKSFASLLALGAFTVLASTSQAVECDDTNGASLAWPVGSSDFVDLDCGDGTEGRAIADDTQGQNGEVRAFIDGVNGGGQATLQVVAFQSGDLVCQAIANENQDDEDACDAQPTQWGALLRND
jgi:hypothetical protein